MTNPNQTPDLQNMLDIEDLSMIQSDNVESLRAQIGQLKQELEQVKNDANLKNMQLVSQRNINKNSENHQELQRKRIIRLEETIANMKRQYEQLRTTKPATSTINVTQNTISVGRLEALNQTISALQTEIQSYKINAQNQSAIIEEFKEKAEQQEMLISEMRNENNLLQKDNQRKNANISELNERLELQKNQLAARNSQASTLRKQLQKSTISAASTLSKKTDSTLQGKNADLIKQRTQLKAKIDELQKKNSVFESQLSQSNKKVRSLDSQIKEANKSHLELRNRCKELEEETRKAINRVPKIHPVEYQKPVEVQKQKDESFDLDDDESKLVFPNKHKKQVDQILSYLKQQYDWKERIAFLNIMGAISQNMIDEMSNASLIE